MGVSVKKTKVAAYYFPRCPVCSVWPVSPRNKIFFKKSQRTPHEILFHQIQNKGNNANAQVELKKIKNLAEFRVFQKH